MIFKSLWIDLRKNRWEYALNDWIDWQVAFGWAWWNILILFRFDIGYNNCRSFWVDITGGDRLFIEDLGPFHDLQVKKIESVRVKAIRIKFAFLNSQNL